MKKVGSGTAMRTHRVHVRFAPAGHGLGTPSDLDVTEVRKALRTDNSIPEIAAQFGVHPHTLANFIRRRNLGNLWERRIYLGRQRAINVEKPLDTRKG